MFLTEKVKSLISEFDMFCEKACAKSATFHFWCQFLCLTDQLLNLFRVDRDGNLELSLDTIAHIMPY